ncbi:hypothetical protein BLNAU_6846 [Blattamonas nauphoetae]|uniref:Uncharacterized protein n=1 Tax=Blattamonas nauphoetae TaxID=2049346 RepID=A0ABQ9Y319_9EUKA|nr:hypothetical protein BLNAU_6846 [Blattamonas nauphoetae]
MVATLSFTASLTPLLLEGNTSTDCDDWEGSEDVVTKVMVVLDPCSVVIHALPLPSASHLITHTLALPSASHLITHTLALPSASPSPPTPSHSLASPLTTLGVTCANDWSR